MTLRKEAIEANYLSKIIQDQRITKAGQRITVYLLERVNKQGYASSSHRMIATDLSLSVQGVIKAIKRLEACGYFAIKRVEKPGSGHINEYTPQLNMAKRGE
jgi:DNA-directed RNA polymerase specialized sigma54-like protein